MIRRDIPQRPWTFRCPFLVSGALGSSLHALSRSQKICLNLVVVLLVWLRQGEPSTTDARWAVRPLTSSELVALERWAEWVHIWEEAGAVRADDVGRGATAGARSHNLLRRLETEAGTLRTELDLYAPRGASSLPG